MRWVTIGEAAKVSGMSESRIRRLCNMGRINSKRHSPNGWRYVNLEQIQKYLDSLKAEYGIDHNKIRERMRSRCKSLLSASGERS